MLSSMSCFVQMKQPPSPKNLVTPLKAARTAMEGLTLKLITAVWRLTEDFDIHPAVKRTGIPSTSTNQKLTTVEILVGLTLHRMQLL